MKGNCKDCAKRETCTKDFGTMYGYCNSDFVLDVKKVVTDTLDKVETEELEEFKRRFLVALMFRRMFGLISEETERLTLEAVKEYSRG